MSIKGYPLPFCFRRVSRLRRPFFLLAVWFRPLLLARAHAGTPSTRPSSSSVLQTPSLISSIPLGMSLMEGDAKPRPPQASAPATPSISVTAPRFLLGQHEATSRRQSVDAVLS